jgi:vacuolar-type H+-ATPase subunit E/Vma4
MALQEIINEIYVQFDAENNEVLNQARMAADEVIVNKADALNSHYSSERKTLEADLKKMEAKLKAKVDLEVFREKQKAESEMVESLLDEAYHEIIKVIRNDPDNYKKFLVKKIYESVKILDSDKISISLSKEDEKYFGDIKDTIKIEMELLPSAKISGGVICTAGDSYIDNSIEMIFNRKKPQFIKTIADGIK